MTSTCISLIISVKKELVRIHQKGQKDALPAKQSQRLAAQRNIETSQPVFPEREVVPQTEPTSTPRKRTGAKDLMQPNIKIRRLEDIVSDDPPG